MCVATILAESVYGILTCITVNIVFFFYRMTIYILCVL